MTPTEVPETEAKCVSPSLAACAHCGLPSPPPSEDDPHRPTFCCAGCEAVYGFLHQEGLAAYYRLREGAAPRPPESVGRGFEEMDDPVYAAHHVRPQPNGMASTELVLEGVHCAACVWLVERALEHEPGLAEARLDYVRARLMLSYRPDLAKLSSIARRLQALGYVPHPVRLGKDQGRSPESRDLLIRAGVAGAVAGNVMLMAFALYGGWLSGMDPEYWGLFRIMSLVVSVPAVTYSAIPFYRGAWAGLRHGALHMDLPISLGILAGFVSGVVNTIRGAGDVYFDSVTALVFLLLAGRLLQLGQQRRAREAAELLGQLVPSVARRIESETTRSVPLEAIEPGDLVEVRVDERIPADGLVDAGRSSVDVSLLTGESAPIHVAPGDAVFGGTTNLVDTLRIRVTLGVRSSRVARIADMVAEAERSRVPVVQLADRVARVFVGVVLSLSVLTFVGWSVFVSVARGLEHAVALLIVSCPCALALATPLALAAAIGKAAKRGMLVRTGAALEILGSLRRARIFFDKTGTLTLGRLEVVRWSGLEDARPFVAAVERGTTHPVGRAIGRFVGQPTKTASRITIVPGGGVEGVVDGREVMVGSPAFVRAKALHDAFRTEEADAWSRLGWTPVWVAIEGRVVASAALADELRPEAEAVIRALEGRGHVVEILSGDHAQVVRTIGARLGLKSARCHGEVSPEGKRARIEAAMKDGPVVMVGDGINDAAALAASTVGIAVTGGAESCLEVADVFIQGDGGVRVLELLEGARRTVKVIRMNVAFSLVYNLFGAGLAMSGHLSPLVAAVLMPLSSVFVCTNAYRFSFSSKAGVRQTSSGA